MNKINNKLKKMMNKINNKLNPNWVTGFTDGEGSFMILLEKNKKSENKWQVKPCFQIALHTKDKDLLLQIKSFFGGIGNINTYSNLTSYKVIKINDIIKIIIPHFEKYSLITQKQADFIIFKNIVELISKGEHLNEKGLVKIINFRASLNNGLSDKLKISFPNAIKLFKSEVKIPNNIDLYWIAGFFSGEGCFYINITKAIDYKIGYSIRLQIIFSQHSRDKILLNKLMNTLKCGRVFKHPKRDIMSLVISNFEDIYTKIIPLFNEYKIKGIKSLDYEDFCKAAEIVKKGDHIKLVGLEQIKLIKSKMNKKRINSKNF
jgi:LAGLIDADG DNA endonuclease family protein